MAFLITSSDLNSMYNNNSAGAGQGVQGTMILLTATAQTSHAVTPTLRKSKAAQGLSFHVLCPNSKFQQPSSHSLPSFLQSLPLCYKLCLKDEFQASGTLISSTAAENRVAAIQFIHWSKPWLRRQQSDRNVCVINLLIFILCNELPYRFLALVWKYCSFLARI